YSLRSTLYCSAGVVGLSWPSLFAAAIHRLSARTRIPPIIRGRDVYGIIALFSSIDIGSSPQRKILVPLSKAGARLIAGRFAVVWIVSGLSAKRPFCRRRSGAFGSSRRRLPGLHFAPEVLWSRPRCRRYQMYAPLHSPGALRRSFYLPVPFRAVPVP